MRDVGLAEELAQDALVAALEQWPESGVPDNPGAWLMATAKHRAIDRLRRSKMLERKHEELGRELEARQETAAPDLDAAIDDDVGDDLLRLVFIACHPVLSTEARVALTLRLLGGLTTDEIARAFLVPEPTDRPADRPGQADLAEARVPFEVPRGAELAARLSSVLEVIYLIFNEGYSATAGDDWMRPALCEDALRLGRILAGLAPKEPEVHGLVALMEIQASRSRRGSARRASPVLLLDQDRARWDQLLIRRGLAALARAEALGGARGRTRCRPRSPPATRGRAPPRRPTGPRIAALYDALAQLTPSPVVELNRAVAVAMAFGPAAGLELVDALTSEPSLEGYHLLPSVRGDLLAKLGRFDEARAEFERAASLTRNARERARSETKTFPSGSSSRDRCCDHRGATNTTARRLREGSPRQQRPSQRDHEPPRGSGEHLQRQRRARFELVTSLPCLPGNPRARLPPHRETNSLVRRASSRLRQAARAVSRRRIARHHRSTEPRPGTDDRVSRGRRGGGADYIVSGDQDLLSLGEHHGIPIVSPARFLAILSEAASP